MSVHEGTMVMSLMQSLPSFEKVAIVVLIQASACEVSLDGMPLTRTTKGFLGAAVVGTVNTRRGNGTEVSMMSRLCTKCVIITGREIC